MAIKKYYRTINCPYYIKDVDIRLVCEGFTEGMQTVNNTFPDREALLEHRREQCMKHWKECPIKLANDIKNGREGKERPVEVIEMTPKERHNLKERWRKKVENDQTGWADFDDFVRWCVENGFEKGRQMRKANPNKPHSPANSFFYNPNERTGVCTGCKQKCPADGHGCSVWQERWVRNWDNNIRSQPKAEPEVPKQPEKPPQREKFRYEAPDLIREGITFGR